MLHSGQLKREGKNNRNGRARPRKTTSAWTLTGMWGEIRAASVRLASKPDRHNRWNKYYLRQHYQTWNLNHSFHWPGSSSREMFVLTKTQGSLSLKGNWDEPVHSLDVTIEVHFVSDSRFFFTCKRKGFIRPFLSVFWRYMLSFFFYFSISTFY